MSPDATKAATLPQGMIAAFDSVLTRVRDESVDLHETGCALTATDA